MRAGLIREAQLAPFALWAEVAERLREQIPKADPRVRRSRQIATLIDALVSAAIEYSAARVDDAAPADLDALRRHPERLVGLPADRARELRELKLFLYENLYYHPTVKAMTDDAIWGIAGSSYQGSPYLYRYDPGSDSWAASTSRNTWRRMGTLREGWVTAR